MESKPQKKVLISPLAWGLGHATRIIPIIYELSQKGYSIKIATNTELGCLLKDACPFVEIIEFYSPKIRFSSGRAAFISILLFSVKLPFIAIVEYLQLKKLLKRETFSYIISDNRYGFRSPNTKSIIITHQLRVLPPKPFGFIIKQSEWLIKHLLSKFDEVWIPDFGTGTNIAGLLSEANGLKNLRYIGPISRFALTPTTTTTPEEWDLIVVGSGPEPQKSEFLNIIAGFLRGKNLRCLVLKGEPLEKELETDSNITYIGNMGFSQLALTIANAKYVISRSGYSTIMDLIHIGKSAILIPTPGQTEQEYLAERMKSLGWFITIKQNELPRLLDQILNGEFRPAPPKFSNIEIFKGTVIE